ncbi:Protein of unknown function [Tindallia magadiensis]|uniref:DUF4446 family protein n=1 Tax=Tindallia magadiensis TaxID=69895 RepID=A0A1I3GF49_9FIRM|nr:DUF4446 family protein [Tindallia magadiensis]SFI22155.1 Protein of unknown function [Tindallia magadiensis]
MINWNQMIGHQVEMYLGISLMAILILSIIVIVLWINLIAFKKKFKQLMKGAEGQNIETIMLDQQKAMEAHHKTAEENRDRMEAIEEQLKDCVQRVGIVRFNAFDDIGSSLSYSIAVLDDHMNGVVLTGIHGRYESSSYAKEVKRGVSEQHLSVEEVEAIRIAREKHQRQEAQA